ncbi:PREDICTED: protein ABHD11 [Ipomoea nil]|uniref:protein ABHD11 n=1 Tax=Ipomoea nil TaxID=35883 RepID=UPI000901CDDE|nr:PREDICTED: protein ABHD11 [Ipomoea nil]
MSAISNFTAGRHALTGAALRESLPIVGSEKHSRLKMRISRSLDKAALRHSNGSSIRMTLVDERLAHRKVVMPSEVLAYELVQGAKVRWSYIMDKSLPEPPTAVLLHGILGSRKNWGSFARRLAKEFPKWQFLLVDLWCHGDSTSIKKKGPHTVASAALDVLKLLGHLRLTPRVVVGHSFGGKVALSMVDQVAKPLARPVRVWVLDATPGKVRAGGDGDDHPAELITFLSALPKEVSSKRDVAEALTKQGFSKDVAQWVVTNLRQTNPSGTSPASFSWVFDLKGIAEMYQSYEETNMWKIVEDVPRGVHVSFLKAERSLHRWALEDIRRIHSAEEQASKEGGGVEMHVLEDAGHWVHADNPDGLFKILSFSFHGF